MSEPITKAQIAKIWASAHGLGLTKETLYPLVPGGSISHLTRQEASELIEHIAALAVKRGGDAVVPSPTPPASSEGPADPNAATAEQRHFIYFLFGRLGWLEQPARMRGFLHKFAKVESVEAIPDRKRASAIIEALKAIHRRRTMAGKM